MRLVQAVQSVRVDTQNAASLGAVPSPLDAAEHLGELLRMAGEVGGTIHEAAGALLAPIGQESMWWFEVPCHVADVLARVFLVAGYPDVFMHVLNDHRTSDAGGQEHTCTDPRKVRVITTG